MRQTQSKPQSSWSHYAKAAAVFTLTTATYLFARTTGWLPGWLSHKESPEDIDSSTALTVSSAEENFQAAALTDLYSTEINSRQFQLSSMQRRLLQQQTQQSTVTLVNPIPDQLIEIGQPYTLSLDNVFSGNYTLLSAVETGKTSLPDWLSLQYNLIGNYLVKVSSGLRFQGLFDVVDNLVFVANYNVLQIVDVSISNNPRLLSSYALNLSSLTGIVVSGSRAFVASPTAGLLILNVSNLSSIQLLGNYSCVAWEIVVSGNMAFVMNSTELLIVNVTIPSNPQLLSRYPGISDNVGYTVSDNLLFIANFNALQILDVSTPSNPRLLSSFPAGLYGVAYGVAVSGSMAFVANGPLGLLILDVSIPGNPQLLGSYPLNNMRSQAVGVVILDNTVFVMGIVGELQVMDVSTPSNPRLLGSYPAGSVQASGIAVLGNRVFLLDSTGFKILDMSQGILTGTPLISNLKQQVTITLSAGNVTQACANTVFTLTVDQFPYLIQNLLSDQIIFPDHTLSLQLDSDLLFANPSNSFLSLSMTSRSMSKGMTLQCVPIAMSTYPVNATLGQIQGIAVSGDMVFVTIRTAGLLILNVSTPSAPRLLGNYSAQSGQVFGQVKVSGTAAFVTAGTAGLLTWLLILDVSRPNIPSLISNYSVGSFSPGTWIRGIAVSDSTVFVASKTALLILDVTVLNAPLLLGSYAYPANYWASGIGISGSTVFVVADGHLFIVDVTVPSSPQLLGDYYYKNGYTYVFNQLANTVLVIESNGFLILNISTLTGPQSLGSSYLRISSIDPGFVRVSGQRVFVAGGSALQIMDLSTPGHPQLLGNYSAGSLNSFFGPITVSGNIAFVADDFGLQILDLSKWIFTINPNTSDVGNYPMRLGATDDLGGSSYIDFTIRVQGPPQLNGSIRLQQAWVEQLFTYFVPTNLFVDPNNDVIGYSASLSNAKSLPSWLQFNPLTIGFSGVPQSSDWGNIAITLSATDHVCPEIPAVNFTISVGFLPVLSHRIPNQLVPIGSTYQFVVPKNSFFDPGGLVLSYLAQGVNNQPLPNWLQFNSSSLLFFGVANTSNITVYTLQLIATNSAGGQVIALFTLRTDHFPVFNKILSLPVARVNEPWVWALPSDAFTDADGDPLTYTATQEDGSVLPSWLSFNPITRTFRGVPLFSGTQGLKITAQDNYGGINSTYFNATILSASLSGPEIVPPRGRAGKLFEFQVNASSILGNDKTYIYSASLADGASLPSWLQFIANNLSFTGLPTSSDVGSYAIALLATDSQGIQYNISLALNVNPNYPPQVYLPISNQMARVNLPFVFYVSGQAFVDQNGDNLTYTVNSLPSWLSFDPQQLKFWGTPARSDTDPLTAHTNNIELTAHDDESQTSTLFTISVQGTSSLLLFLQVGIPLLTGLTSLYKAYQKRALMLNRCCKNRIVKHESIATTGEEFQVDLKTEPKEFGRVQVKLPKPSVLLYPGVKLGDGASSCWSRLFRPCKRVMKESPDHLPPTYPLPLWLKYSDNNRLLSIGRVPDVNHPKFTVQVLNRAGVIREELNVTVQPPRV